MGTMTATIGLDTSRITDGLADAQVALTRFVVNLYYPDRLPVEEQYVSAFDLGVRFKREMRKIEKLVGRPGDSAGEAVE